MKNTYVHVEYLVIPCTFKCKQFLNNLKFCMIRYEKEINCKYFSMFMAPLKSSIIKYGLIFFDLS